MNKLKILFHIAHPAQFHMFKHLIHRLIDDGHHIKITINTKDILEDLLKASNLPYENILKKRRKKNTRLAAILALLKKDMRLFQVIFNQKFDLLIGTEFALTHVGLLLRKTVLTFTEDDAHIIKDAAKIALPFSTKIVAPNVCDLGKFEAKKIGYEGYQKLAYLHPNYFSPNPEILKKVGNEDYFLIRLSGLNAYHDRGAQGFSEEEIHQLINKLEVYGTVYISAENELPDSLKTYTLKTNIDELHDVLYFAQLLICDSQSTAVEASILGTPSIRYNSFAGKISVLEELEHKYHLTFGIAPPNIKQVFSKLDDLLIMSGKDEWETKRQKMLNDKIDVVEFWYRIILRFGNKP